MRGVSIRIVGIALAAVSVAGAVGAAVPPHPNALPLPGGEGVQQAGDSAAVVFGALPRQGDRPLETHAGLETRYDVVPTRDGTRLRAVITRPAKAAGRLPAILFLQWLSCDTVEIRASREDGWSRMLRRVARESGLTA